MSNINLSKRGLLYTAVELSVSILLPNESLLLKVKLSPKSNLGFFL